MKKIFLCTVCAIAFILLTSCDEESFSGNGTTNTDIPVNVTASDITDNQAEETPESNAGTVPATPEQNTQNVGISLDSITDIQVLDNGFYSVFSVESLENPENNKYGVIDGNGNIVFGPVSDYIFPCDGHKTIGIYAYGENEYELPLYLGNGYYITEHGGHGGSNFVCYVYHNELERYYAVHQNEGGAYIAQVYAIPDDTAYIVCEDSIKGIKNIEDPYTVLQSYIDEMGYWDYTPEEYHFYLSARNEKMSLSDFEYVSPEFVNGYLICKKDGKYGYLSGKGEEITGYIFDEARVPFYDKAWVKIDGKWQTIDLTRFS